MLETLSSAEYTELLAFAEREPLPQVRADDRAAMIAFVTARAAGAKGAKLGDFIVDYDAAPATDEEQSPEEMDRQMHKLAALIDARTNTDGVGHL